MTKLNSLVGAKNETHAIHPNHRGSFLLKIRWNWFWIL